MSHKIYKGERVDENRGKISHQIWSATSGVNIPKGAEVRVIDWEGVHVIVEEVEGEEIVTPPKRGEAKV